MQDERTTTQPVDDRPENAVARVTATRVGGGPLITAASSPTIGSNINGPSVIRVPDWIANPLGRYYMYFAHHSGDHIRLAYADRIGGPWAVHQPGTLRLEQAAAFTNHIASPDVHVDHEGKQLRMYFHGPARERKGQWSGVAHSTDGLNFDASDLLLGKFYFRVFTHDAFHYAIAKAWNDGFGELSRSPDGTSEFEGGRPFIDFVRHTAVTRRGDQLLVFYSCKGDVPERILLSTVDLSQDWTAWRESRPLDVIRPERAFEGTNYALKPSTYGGAIEVQQLRDPCIFEEAGDTWLFYTTAGEMGIALAKLDIEMK